MGFDQVRSVREADNADRLEPIRDRGQLPHDEALALKAADAVVEQKGLLPAMHLRKKGAQGVHIRLTIETIDGSPLVTTSGYAWAPWQAVTWNERKKAGFDELANTMRGLDAKG